MNILLINTLEKGGAASACIRLHKGLLNQGVNSKFLFANLFSEGNKIQASSNFWQEYKDKGELFYQKKRIQYYIDFLLKSGTLKFHPKGYEPFQFPSSIHDITKHPLYEWADIINFHWVANFLDWRSFFTKNTKPIVWTLHDMLPFTGGYHYEEGFPLSDYQSQINKNLKLKTKSLEENQLNIVAPSRWLNNKAKASELFSKQINHCIPNGIDTSIFRPIEQKKSRKVFNLPTEKKMILFVADSTANKRKGFDYLTQALPLLNRKDIILGVLGDGSSSIINDLNIFKLGRINDEELMAQAYSAADLFVIPSVEDNLPNTVIESIICGTPAVGFNIGGIPDMIISGKNGFLCNDIIATALATTIDQALATNWDRKWIRQDAVERYDQSVQAKRYVELFHSILDNT